MTTLSKVAVFEALKSALEAPVTPGRSPACGCGRVYVVLSKAPQDRPLVNAFAAAAKKLGALFLRKAYGTCGNALYCGYDNADGRALAKAHAVAKVLGDNGIGCYVDAVAD